MASAWYWYTRFKKAKQALKDLDALRGEPGAEHDKDPVDSNSESDPNRQEDTTPDAQDRPKAKERTWI